MAVVVGVSLGAGCWLCRRLVFCAKQFVLLSILDVEDMRPLLVFNWKTYIATKADAVLLATDLKGMLDERCIVCPSSIHLHSVAAVLRDTGVAVGAQDIAVHPDVQTGSASGGQLRDAGASHCIVGHAETRRYGVSDRDVAEKVANAHRSSIIPIVCVTNADQLRAVAPALEDSAIVAFEPEQYIGAQEAMPVDEIMGTGEELRSIHDATLLYGGSVDGNNVKEVLGSGVDGLLVGRAGVSREKIQPLLSIV